MTTSLFIQQREKLELLVARRHEQQQLEHMAKVLGGLGEKYDYDSVSSVAAVTDTIHDYVCAARILNQARELRGDEKRVVDLVLALQKQCDLFIHRTIVHYTADLEGLEREQDKLFTEHDITTRLEELTNVAAIAALLKENLTPERQTFSRWKELLVVNDPLLSLEEQAHQLHHSYSALLPAARERDQERESATLVKINHYQKILQNLGATPWTTDDRKKLEKILAQYQNEKAEDARVVATVESIVQYVRQTLADICDLHTHRSTYRRELRTRTTDIGKKRHLLERLDFQFTADTVLNAFAALSASIQHATTDPEQQKQFQRFKRSPYLSHLVDDLGEEQQAFQKIYDRKKEAFKAHVRARVAQFKETVESLDPGATPVLQCLLGELRQYDKKLTVLCDLQGQDIVDLETITEQYDRREELLSFKTQLDSALHEFDRYPWNGTAQQPHLEFLCAHHQRSQTVHAAVERLPDTLQRKHIDALVSSYETTLEAKAFSLLSQLEEERTALEQCFADHRVISVANVDGLVQRYTLIHKVVPCEERIASLQKLRVQVLNPLRPVHPPVTHYNFNLTDEVRALAPPAETHELHLILSGHYDLSYEARLKRSLSCLQTSAERGLSDSSVSYLKQVHALLQTFTHSTEFARFPELERPFIQSLVEKNEYLLQQLLAERAA